MKQTVLVALPRASSYGPGLLRAFNYLKIDSSWFDYRSFSLLEKAIVLIGQRNKAIELMNMRLIDAVKKSGSQILFALKGELINEQTIKELNRNGVITINWFPDHVDALPLAARLSKVYRFFFHFDPLAIRQLRKKGRKVYYLPFCGDILPSDKVPKKQKALYKVSFVGNYNARREKLLKSVSDLGLAIWGDSRWANSSLKENYKGYLPSEEMKGVVAQSIINLNIQHDYPSEGAVLRVLEVISYQGFLLTEKRKDIANLFKLGVEYDDFSSSKQLRQKVNYYLANQTKTRQMAKKGYLKAARKHTYISRIRGILSVVYG